MDKHYAVRQLTEGEFRPLFDQHKASVFEATHSYDFQSVLSQTERRQMDELGAASGNRHELYLGAFDAAGCFVGWTWGYQERGSTFYMVNSGVLREHRRHGIYTALLQTCIEHVCGQGFQLVYSRHCCTNNAVIIPKLKAGFVISKMEVDDRFGVLIHLHFYTNPTRRSIMDYRSGLTRPDESIRTAFRMP